MSTDLEMLEFRFSSAKSDLSYALKYARSQKELLFKPDFSGYCDTVNLAFIQALFTSAAGHHSYCSFLAAIINFDGSLTEFLNSDHIDRSQRNAQNGEHYAYL